MSHSGDVWDAFHGQQEISIADFLRWLAGVETLIVDKQHEYARCMIQLQLEAAAAAADAASPGASERLEAARTSARQALEEVKELLEVFCMSLQRLPMDLAELSAFSTSNAALGAGLAASGVVAAAVAGTHVQKLPALPPEALTAAGDCPICLLPLRGDAPRAGSDSGEPGVVALECGGNGHGCGKGHVFHRACLLDWCKLSDRCPLCRAAIAPEESTEAAAMRQQRPSSAAANFAGGCGLASWSSASSPSQRGLSTGGLTQRPTGRDAAQQPVQLRSSLFGWQPPTAAKTAPKGGSGGSSSPSLLWRGRPAAPGRPGSSGRAPRGPLLDRDLRRTRSQSCLPSASIGVTSADQLVSQTASLPRKTQPGRPAQLGFGKYSGHWAHREQMKMTAKLSSAEAAPQDGQVDPAGSAGSLPAARVLQAAGGGFGIGVRPRSSNGQRVAGFVFKAKRK
eukprot:TRINITY_DN54348_c0_g1_i2.p1 TRINITY_DN54348_c0_g1~~TRINITY_DN54348_c0_g1_i2.p1  ORF type:complete len:453 (-),score=118.29 TRINITY_DN54348_c0_g1_i2:177-1535(-)